MSKEEIEKDLKKAEEIVKNLEKVAAQAPTIKVDDVSDKIIKHFDLYQKNDLLSDKGIYEKLTNKTKQSVVIKDGKAYVAVTLKKTCKGFEPTDGEIAELALHLSGIPSDKIDSFLKLGGYLRLEPSIGKAMLFSIVLVEAGYYQTEYEI